MTVEKSKLAIVMAALSCLTACDYSAKKDLQDERESRQYRSAMVDYKAGRIDAAMKGFEKVVKSDPSNAGARFQYACLLQDLKKDCLAAFLAYHEYVLQHPESDKAKVARERLKLCEKEVAAMLAERHGLIGDEGPAKEIERLSAKVRELEEKLAASEKTLKDNQAALDAVTGERDRLVSAVKSVEAHTDQTPGVPDMKGVKELLEEEDSAERTGYAEDIAKLRAEEKEELATGSTLLPAQTKEDIARRDAKEAEKREREDERRNKTPSHPPTYVVQEGDTLYRIAVRFYGRLSAWKMIRDANKAVISNDGRVRAGVTIVLPGP